MPLNQVRQDQIAQAVQQALIAIGTPEGCKHSAGTPTRVAKMLSTILDGYTTPFPLDRMTAFDNDGSYRGIVMVHHVPFYSFCAHHLMPFFGQFALGYLPGARIIGLSKLVRCFRWGCKRPTTQEDVTQLAVTMLNEVIETEGVICHVTAEHTCMSMRGVQAHGARTTTIAYSGLFGTDIALRNQFLSEAQRPQLS